jgi:hypothetical protein
VGSRSSVGTSIERGRSGWRDVIEGVGGLGIMAASRVTPCLRARRNRWGLDRACAGRTLAGDALVAEPRWSWTHGIEIDAPAEAVWPWVAQVGADRGGFYSYQWLQNLAGCRVRNANAVQPRWAVKDGDGLVLHPKMPPMRVVMVEPDRSFVAFGAPDDAARRDGRPWIAASWLFLVEPLGAERCRFVSRYRCATSDDLGTRLRFGPAITEPIGFAMDRRMLLGVKQRAERSP